LFHERFFPVGNPQLLATGRRIRQPSDLLQFPLLHDHLQNWPVWLRSAAGIEEPAPKNMFLHDCFLAINAARQGYGIALADIMEVAEDLRKGTLIMLSDQTVPASAAVMLVRHPESREHLRARAFSEQVVRTVSQVRNQVY
jgi:LysR family glycine cleavage system transcriptional activator